MPELNDVVGKDAAGTTDTAVAETATTATDTAGTGVVDATVVPKQKIKKNKTPPADTGTAPVAETPVPKKKKVEAASDDSAEKKDIFLRPPMEQIARDIERIILEHKVGDHDIKKLPYKCGKIIFGLAGQGGKDFRVIALKARKKTKSVAGKSRCIYYFGINEDHSKILKEIPGTATTKFGCCSVQSKKPIELILDKTSYKEAFNQNADEVVAAITKLIGITVEQKNTQYEAMLEAAKAKEKTADEKAVKKAKKEKAEATA